jgi:hypothetical protein
VTAVADEDEDLAISACAESEAPEGAEEEHWADLGLDRFSEEKD